MEINHKKVVCLKVADVFQKPFFIHPIQDMGDDFKGFKIKLEIDNIPLSNYSSFLFNTYEYNDRILVEKYIDKKSELPVINDIII